MMTKAENSRLHESTRRPSAPRVCIIPACLALGLTLLVSVAGNNWPVRAATNRFVAVGGNDTSNDCSNAGSPCATIQHAVDQSASGDTINVAAGTYFENVTVGQTVTILGDGTTGSTVNGGNVNPVFTIIEGATVKLSTLTITNGNASGESNVGGGIQINGSTVTVVQCAGGGIFNDGSSTLTVINSTISGNQAVGGDGGGMLNASNGSGGGGTATFVN